LLSIPGIGELTARTLLAEIETLHRFSDPEKLISYAGLAPRVRQSSTMDRRGDTHETWFGVAAHGARGICADRRPAAQPVSKDLSPGELPTGTQRGHHRRRSKASRGDLACVV